MPGTWSVAAVLDRCPSLVEGLKEMTAGKANILYAKGSNLISDASYEERATMFGRSLNRDNRTDQQLLDEALTVANQSDIIIAALGESSEMSGESSSRTDLNIPDVQQNLLKELLKTGKPVVLVLFTGRPLTLTWEQEHVPAILNVWFGGSEAAYAIGDALFGYVNPGGKLTMSFPKNVGQIPLYYAHKNTGRPLAQGKWFEKFRSNYLDVDNEPLYPFGYGLLLRGYRPEPFYHRYDGRADGSSNGDQYRDMAGIRSSATLHSGSCRQYHPSGERTERLSEDIPRTGTVRDCTVQDCTGNAEVLQLRPATGGRTGRVRSNDRNKQPGREIRTIHAKIKIVQ